jgi:hypothetical protein
MRRAAKAHLVLLIGQLGAAGQVAIVLHTGDNWGSLSIHQFVGSGLSDFRRAEAVDVARIFHG